MNRQAIQLASLLDLIVSKKLFYTIEKALAVWRSLIPTFGLELFEQFFLALVQLLRRFNFDLNEHIAGQLLVKHRHALSIEP